MLALQQSKCTHKFPVSWRIKKNFEFLKVKRHGQRQSGRFVRVNALWGKNLGVYSSDDIAARLGVVISRKIGNAAVRNVWRRRIREIFRVKFFDRYREQQWPKSDVVIVVHRHGPCPPINALENDIESLLENLYAGS